MDGLIALKKALLGAKAYTDEIAKALAGGLKYKGSVATKSALPLSNNKLGYMYTTDDTGHEHVWTKDATSGTLDDWLDLNKDLANYYKKTEVDALLLALKNELIASIATKQDIISDLDSIRSGASLGATSLQQSDKTELQNNITQEVNDRTTAINTVNESLNQETLTRELADTTLQNNINTHIDNLNNPHTVTKSQVGLSEVDNTSDINKPISMATQTALNNKQDILTAGDNIQINNNIISAIDTIYDDTEVRNLISTKANDSDVVKLDGDLTIYGQKVFKSPLMYENGLNATRLDDKKVITSGAMSPEAIYKFPDGNGEYTLATESWVEDKGYLTEHLDISGKLNKLPNVDDPTDPGYGYPYWIPYNFSTTVNADKVDITLKTLTLDNQLLKHEFTNAFPAATTTTAGTMSAADKVKLDAAITEHLDISGKLNKLPNVDDPSDPGYGYPYWIPYNFSFTPEANDVKLTLNTLTLDNNLSKMNFEKLIPTATTTVAGFMSAQDKVDLANCQSTIENLDTRIQFFEKVREPELKEISGKQHLYANGTSLRIVDNSTSNIAYYADSDGVQKTIDIPYGAIVHGGGLGTATNRADFPSSMIIMESGNLRSIYGGSRACGNVGVATIVVNGGTLIEGPNGGGAAPNANELVTVGKANIIMNGGTSLTVYGGGMGRATVGDAYVEINNGTHKWITAGGANGTTGKANVVINGGNITCLQTVNRGIIELATIKVNSGTITNLYAGGETGDSSVNGKCEKAILELEGGTFTLNKGTYGGTEDASRCSGYYLKGVITTEAQKTIAAACNLTEKELTATQDWVEGKGYLTSHQSIKTINGSSLIGTGNVDIKTFQPFPSDFKTGDNGETVEQMVDSIINSTGAIEGMAYLGSVYEACSPFGYGNAECLVEFMGDGLAVLTVSSSNISPYHWELNTAGGEWRAWSEVKSSTTGTTSDTASYLTINGEEKKIIDSTAVHSSDISDMATKTWVNDLKMPWLGDHGKVPEWKTEDPGAGYAFHIPYNFTFTPDANKLDIKMYTITADGNNTYNTWDNTLPPANSIETMSYQNAGLMTSSDATALRNTIPTQLGGLTLKPLTLAEYDALTVKDANTLYIIK